jgi:16S rRNA (guanine527-N7)-methyltransferase
MLEERLEAGAAALGLAVEPAQMVAFRRYYDLLVEWNARFNLTRITGEDEVATKHLLDSLVVLRLPVSREWRRLADIGSGAGFPGIPLRIMRPDLDVTLIEATGKKVGFLEAVIGELGLSGVRAIHARGEEVGREPEFREAFDVVTARAVARLNLLVEYCVPLVRVGGQFVAYKGPEGGAELQEAEAGCGELGVGEAETVELELPDNGGRRALVVMTKDRHTPAGYPRPGAKIAKRPL